MCQLCGELSRKAFDLPGAFADDLGADHDVSEQLAFVGILIGRKGGKLRELSDVMKDRSGDQQVPVHKGIMFCDVIADGRNA